MTGRSAPTERQLTQNMEKRMYIPAAGPGSRIRTKRYNRQGVELVAKGKNNAAGKAKGKGGKGKAAAYVNFMQTKTRTCTHSGKLFSAGAAGAGAAAAAAGAAKAAGAGAAGNATAAAGSGPGFSEVAEQASEAGGLTLGNTPTTGNSLALDIE
jgi:hypothetical protein